MPHHKVWEIVLNFCASILFRFAGSMMTNSFKKSNIYTLHNYFHNNYFYHSFISVNRLNRTSNPPIHLINVSEFIIILSWK